MRAFHRAAVLLRSWFRAGAVDDEFREELQFHLERQIRANVDAGMTGDEAARAARLSLGGIEALRDASREARPGAGIRQIARDVGYGIRLLRKSPMFAAASVAIVSLGIAATTATFSVVYSVMLRPLPYRDPDRLVS